jgi:hypothetical protein
MERQRFPPGRAKLTVKPANLSERGARGLVPTLGEPWKKLASEKEQVTKRLIDGVRSIRRTSRAVPVQPCG